MNKINKKCNKMLWAALLITLMLPAGVVAIPMGAIYGITAVLVLGIVFAVVGFYGTPIIWVNYAACRKQKETVELITESGITDLKTLASSTGKSEKEMSELITMVIAKGYVAGMSFDGQKLNYIEKKKQRSNKCLNCGANLNKDGECKYCGFVANNH